MPRTIDDHFQTGMMRPIVQATLDYLGKDFTKCEFCGKDIPEGKYNIHHTKYEGATIYDLAIICTKCDKQPENRNLI